MPSNKHHGKPQPPYMLNALAAAVTPNGTVLAYSVARLLSATYSGPLYSLNGAFIQTIYDQSGNGADVTEPDPSLQPTFVATSQGGRPAFGFRAFEYIWGSKVFSLPSNAMSAVLVSKGRTEIYASSAASPFAGFLVRGGSNARSELFSGDSEAGGAFAGFISDNSYTVISVRVRSGQNSFRVNGVEQPANNVFDTGGALANMTNIERVGFGALLAGSEGQEIIIMDGYKTDAEIIAAEQDAGAFYGITFP